MDSKQQVFNQLGTTFNKDSDKHQLWLHSQGAALSLALYELSQRWQGPIIHIAEDARLMSLAHAEQQFFAAKDENSKSPTALLEFPDWESLPYDSFSPHRSLISERLQTLHQLLNPSSKASDNGASNIIINTHVDALIQRLPPAQFIHAHSFSLSVNDTLAIDNFRLKLEQANYLNVSQVIIEGEFSIRGGIIDVFPMGAKKPFRIDLFDDVIESIRYFDPQTQQSIGNVNQIQLLPGSEFPFNDASIELFKSNYRQHFDGDLKDHGLYHQISSHQIPTGVEFYFPLFFQQTASFFDYLPDNALLVYSRDILADALTCYGTILDRYDNALIDKKRPPLKVDSLYLTPQGLYDTARKFHSIELVNKDQLNNLAESTANKLSHAFDLGSMVRSDIRIDYQQNEPHQAFINYLQIEMRKEDKRTLIVCETLGRKESLLGVLASYNIKPYEVGSWQGFIQNEATLCITHADLERGIKINATSTTLEQTIEIIAEPELFQDKIYLTQDRRKANSKFSNQDPEAIIRSLDELNVGDPVVHIDHGVGRYKGLETINAGGIQSEYLLLTYANDAKLYVPILSLHLINRYTGGHPDTAPVHTLGSKSWSEQKKKAKQKAYDMAAELLETQALREINSGFVYEVPEKDYFKFCDAFAYEETEDQNQTIDAIIQDMQSGKNMDRLVCGDVGFGKTEVAMRAAFIAAYNKKQVCILVPTTLLAQQHYETFINRFANHAVNIAVVSRLKSTAHSKETMEGFAAGKIDILIGTHKLLQKDFITHDLGLIIIDEEHRFGVRQKEILKKLSTDLDILTLTATPIPRTLNQVMNKLRDISLITTPPKDRIAVKTFVREFNKGLIVEAVNRELHRGGQVYFLHNDVRSMKSMATQLEEWFPKATIGMGHGQMPKHELEETMQNFYHQRYQIFICSTIIENGIDNPHANTILINKADRFGLAQLHQLRGRVGRSNHQAYAYLLTEELHTVSPDAQKRLDAISRLDTLGAGFMLASHDLEIRGAGEILGESQSGSIDTVGLHLYTNYIQQAVKTLKQRKQNALSGISQVIDDDFDNAFVRCEVNFNDAALIPNDYIDDVHLRLVFYKRIAASDEDGLHELKIEMIDRFGLLPDEVKNLFSVTETSLLAQNLGIAKINLSNSGGSIDFTKNTPITPENIIMLVQSNYKTFQFKGSEGLRINAKFESLEEKTIFCEALFKKLQLDG